MTIPRFGSNPTQLQMQMHHMRPNMRPTSSGLQLQPSPFDAKAGDTYAKDSGVPQLVVAAPSRRGFLAKGLATGIALLVAGCGEGEGRHAEPAALPPDGIGDVDGYETFASSDGGRRVSSKNSGYSPGKVLSISGLGVVGLTALTVSGLVLLRRRRANRFDAISNGELEHVMQPNEWHDTGKSVQVRLANPNAEDKLYEDVEGVEAELIRKLAQTRDADSKFRLFKHSTWGKGPKAFNFNMSKTLKAIEVTDAIEAQEARDKLEKSGIAHGWFVRNRNKDAGEDMYVFNLTRYDRPSKRAIKRIIAAQIIAAAAEPAPAALETVGDTGDQDAGGQPQVPIDRHAVVKRTDGGYNLYIKDRRRHVYPAAWQGMITEALAGAKEGKTLTIITRPVEQKGVTKENVRQLLEDFRDAGVLATGETILNSSSEITDGTEYRIVAPVVLKDRAEAKLGNDLGDVVFKVSDAQASQDDGQPSQQNTLESGFDAEPFADGPKKPPYYMGESIDGAIVKITQIVTATGTTIDIPDKWQTALSLCAGKRGCSLTDLSGIFGAFDPSDIPDFMAYMTGLTYVMGPSLVLPGPEENHTPIRITIPSEANALALLDPDEKATKAGVEPASLEALAGAGEDGFTEAERLAAAAIVAKAAPAQRKPPPRSAGRQRVERPLKKVESDQTAFDHSKSSSPTPEAAEKAAPPEAYYGLTLNGRFHLGEGKIINPNTLQILLAVRNAGGMSRDEPRTKTQALAIDEAVQKGWLRATTDGTLVFAMKHNPDFGDALPDVPSATPEAGEAAPPAVQPNLSDPLQYSDSTNQMEFTDVEATILRLSMFGPFVGNIGEHLAILNVTTTERAANRAAMSLVKDGYLAQTDAGLRVPEHLVEYFDIERPEAKAKAAPDTTLVEPEAEEVDDADIIIVGDAEAAPPAEPETKDAVQARREKLEAAQAALTEAKTESSQASDKLEAANQALEAAKKAVDEAKTELREKQDAALEAEGEKAEQKAEQAEAKAKEIFNQKRAALVKAKEATSTADKVFTKARVRWNKAEAAKETAQSALEEAQAKAAAEAQAAAEAAAQAKAAAEAEAKAALSATDPVKAAGAMLSEKIKAAKQAEAALDQALANANAAIDGKKLAKSEAVAAKTKAKAKSDAILDAEDEKAEERAETEASVAKKIFFQKKAVLAKAKKAEVAANERLQETKANYKTAEQEAKEAERTMLKATAAAEAKAKADEAKAKAKAEEKAKAKAKAEAEEAKAIAALPAEDTDPVTLVRNDSEPEDGEKTQRFERGQVTDAVRRAEEKAKAVDSAYDQIMNDGTITVPAVVGRALQKLLKAEGEEFDAHTSNRQMTITLKD